MALFDDLGSFISKTGETLSKKAQEFSAPAINNNNVRIAQRELRNLYYELGKKYYEKSMGADILDADLESLTGKITDKMTEIKELAQAAADSGKITCNACGAKIPKDSVFCPKCGTKTEEKKEEATGGDSGICPRCGNKLEDDMDFCTNCGLDLRTLKKTEKEVESVESKEESAAEDSENEITEE